MSKPSRGFLVGVLEQQLRRFSARGRCADDAAAAWVYGDAGTKQALLAQRWCPPSLSRLAETQSDPDVRAAARGVPGWRSRALFDAATPRGAVAAACRSEASGRVMAAGCSSLPSAMTVRLGQDNDAVIHEMVAAYGACDPQMATLWAHDHDPQIRGRDGTQPVLPAALVAASRL